MSKSTFMNSMLLDFYGKLLTDKQREYYDLHYNEDLSLSEIAEQSGISRQGVWDIISRAEKTMMDMEEKTGFIDKFNERRASINRIQEQLEKLKVVGNDESIELIEKIEKELEGLEG